MMNTSCVNRTKTLILVLLVSCAVMAPAFGANTYTMKEGDTLWDLSAKYYNDPTLYSVFLEVNNIDNPRTIPVGQVIIIPAFDDMKKVAQEVEPTKRSEMIRKLAGDTVKSDQTSKPVPGKDEDGEDIKPVDTKSVSILNILGGKKVNPKYIKNDSGNQSNQDLTTENP